MIHLQTRETNARVPPTGLAQSVKDPMLQRAKSNEKRLIERSCSAQPVLRGTRSGITTGAFERVIFHESSKPMVAKFILGCNASLLKVSSSYTQWLSKCLNKLARPSITSCESRQQAGLRSLKATNEAQAEKLGGSDLIDSYSVPAISHGGSNKKAPTSRQKTPFNAFATSLIKLLRGREKKPLPVPHPSTHTYE